MNEIILTRTIELFWIFSITFIVAMPFRLLIDWMEKKGWITDE